MRKDEVRDDRARSGARRRGEAGQRRDLLRAGQRPFRVHQASTGPTSRRAGVIRDTAGNVLAEHDGIEKFTIGQRKGLGFGCRLAPLRAGDRPGDARRHRRRRGRIAGLRRLRRRTRQLADRSADEPLNCQAKIRYRAPRAAGDGASRWRGDGRFRGAAERHHAGAGGRLLRRRSRPGRRVDRRRDTELIPITSTLPNAFSRLRIAMRSQTRL